MVTTGRAPRLEDLLTFRILRDYGAEFPDDDAALEGLRKLERVTSSRPLLYTFQSACALLAVARHSVLFTVDRDTLVQACGSADDAPVLELPPLPFPSIVVEPDEDAVWAVGDSERDPTMFGVQAFAIEELVQGEEWRGLLVCSDLDGKLLGPTDEFADGRLRNTDASFSLAFTLEPGLMAVRQLGEGAAAWRLMSPRSALGRLVVEAVHFITARGVDHEPVRVDRADRRRAQRAGYTLPPQGPYWVVIRPPTTSEARRSGREYHVRWMVRGHWRRLDDLRRTWVRSYLKGPPGAPWKGTPVYRRGAEQDPPNGAGAEPRVRRDSEHDHS